MGAVLKMLGFILWGAVLPAAAGLLPVGILLPAEERRLSRIVVAGFLTSFTVFELIGLPILFLTPLGNFTLLLWLYAIISIALAAAGIRKCSKTGGTLLTKLIKEWKEAGTLASSPAEESTAAKRSARWIMKAAGPVQTQAVVFWCIFAGLLLFELFMAYTRASFDGDDAYYVAQSLQTWQTGTMYHYVPYTGVSTTLDGRHAMAMIPMWIAAVSRLCGTHPTIVTHSMMPLVLIPLTDLCLYVLADTLIADNVIAKDRKRLLPAFMCIMAVMQIFGNISIYTPETFLLMRNWQGKSVFVNVIVPVCFTALLLVAKRGKAQRFAGFLMVLCNFAAGFCTSIAPVFTAFLFLAGSLYTAILHKDKKIFGRAALCCIPNVMYALILVWIMLPVLLSS